MCKKINESLKCIFHKTAFLQYRAPSIKSKRSITREKYSPKMNAENVHNSSNNIYEVVRSEDEVMNKLLEVEPEVKNTG